MSLRSLVFACAIALMSVTGFAGPAAAQSQTCTGNPGIDWDIQIGACTTAIRSGRWQGKDLARTFNNRGNAYAAKAQYDHAIQDYDRAIKLNPKDAIVRNASCWARAIVGELEQALKDCDTSLTLKPDHASTLDSRALVRLKRNDFHKAIADYDAALKSNPKLAGSLYGRGIAKQRKGDSAGGNADIADAKAIDVKIDETFAGYGVK